MLRKLVNEAKFSLTLTTTGPVLIRSGTATVSMGRNPDMTPVLTYRNGMRQVYFPGSSLKGVFRSHLEKIGRTLNEAVICNPFDTSSFCGDKLQALKERKYKSKTIPTSVAYRISCPICRLFGSTFYTGRISIGDAYLVDETQPRPVELRDGVGIDRFTGGAAHQKFFNLEAISSGIEFKTEVYLRNFECWQLGMILLVVQDLAEGLIRVGSGTSRGMGSVVGEVDCVTVTYVGLPQKAETEVWGLGKFLAKEAADYGANPDDVLSLKVTPKTSEQGIRLINEFKNDVLAELQIETSAAFIKYIQKSEPT